MDSLKLCQFLKQSFIGCYLVNPNITDITYNGKNIFVLDNENGRLDSNILINQQTARDFLRQISNLCEKQFSYQNPFLDVSFANYRINAVHHSIGRFKNEDVVTFSIRIGSSELRIDDNSDFLTPELVSLFKVLIKSKCSVAIAGLTGSGKTELQKYLISLMPERTRAIIVDNVSELNNLQSNEKIDITSWLSNDDNSMFSTNNLIRAALRNNPDWIVIAESRGEEMVDILNSTLTGHPIITTFHAFDIESMPTRMTRMVLMSNKNLDYQTIFEDLTYHIRFYVYTKRDIRDSKVARYVSDVSYFYNGKMLSIYSKKNGHNIYYKLDKKLVEFLDQKSFDKLFIKTFLEKYE